jgi:hypothetical protein
MSHKLSSKAQQIIDSLTDYVKTRGGDHDTWCGGVCHDVQDVVLRMYYLGSRCWTYSEATSPEIAQEVLDYLVGTLGMKQDTADPNPDCIRTTIYIYRKPPHRSEPKPL